MFENILSSFFVDIFVLRFQDFHSLPWSKSALPKRKFNFNIFRGVSIIRSGANIPLPYRISKVILVWKSTFIIFVDIFVLRFQDFHSVPWSKSALPKRKFNFNTFRGVSNIRRGENISLPYRISKVIYVWKSTFIIFCDIFVLRFQDFHSVPRSKSGLPKRKFNFNTFKGMSIILRGANIPLPHWDFKSYSCLKIYFHHFLLTFSCYDLKIFILCHGRNLRYSNKNSTLL